MTKISAGAKKAMLLAKQGDFPAAIELATSAVVVTPNDAGLHFFLGLLHARRDDFTAAVEWFGRACDLAPGDRLLKLQLACALVGADRLDEAERLIDVLNAAGQTVETDRLFALICRCRGDYRLAIAVLQPLIASNADDSDSLNLLGDCLLAMGQAVQAVDAFSRSLALRGHQQETRIRLADAQAAAGMADAALQAARSAIAGTAADPTAWLIVARLEDLLKQPGAAKSSLRQALSLDPGFESALLALAGLYERENSLDDLSAVLARIDAAGVPAHKTSLLRARIMQRRGQLDEALALAVTISPSSERSGRAQIIGEIMDRLGNHAAAFESFIEMNRLIRLEVSDAKASAVAYRERIAQIDRFTTAEWFRGWTIEKPSYADLEIVFMFGFPRSGTTLIDIMLSGHPEVLVIEEGEMLFNVSRRMPVESIGDLDADQIRHLRDGYMRLIKKIGVTSNKRVIIDKSPLGSINSALAYRMFPNAKFIFVERHPCDVVLSCFMTRFVPDAAGANFLDLQDTAQLYDAVLRHWTSCRSIFPFAVHDIRYEQIIEDPEATLRVLAAFIGLAWHPEMLDHRQSARKRGFISTPSYAQVAQPIYRRASGRWLNYRDMLEPVLPWLEPWASRLGYGI